ncbi:hypothetical protein E9993_15720 [Labilibacter sediminis]|nr:hypothetical protein E9993_15720 [Labilibacter sediminis]
MTPTQLFEMIQQKTDLFLVDVRESFEVNICRIEDSVHVPLQSIPEYVDQFPNNKNVVVICHHGVRSNAAVSFLKQKGLSRVYNLDGGIDRWALEVDKQMVRY